MPALLTDSLESDQVGIKPFGLVKFFSFTGLLVFMLFTLILSGIISNSAKQVLLQRSDAYALLLAKNLNYQVFQHFVLPTVIRFGKIALRNQSQFELLDSVVRKAIHGLNVQSVTIYDSDENVISYSMDQDRVGKRDQGGVEYRKALDGIENSRIVINGSMFSLFPGADKISCELITYIPFRQAQPPSQRSDQIMGVIEIVQDLSEDLEMIIRFQGVIILTSVIIMAALFITLWFMMARADRIIEARASERSRLVEKLNQAERLAGLGKMVASVSHEIKNPLGIVRSTAEILGRRLKSIAPGNEHLANIIIEETTRLDGIVREFLDFARPQIPRLAPLRINDILRKVLQFFDQEFEKNNIIPRVELGELVPVIYADADLLYRAFLNVLINAVQAMPEGGVLTVRSSVANSYRKKGAVIEVIDTGKGMTASVREQIFQPFFTNKTRGTGLGLAIVKNIVESHGGAITVESEEGKGASFSIILAEK